MPDLDFRINSAEPVAFAAAPILNFKLHLTNAPAEERIHAVVLRCQIRIEPTKRRYEPREEDRLGDLFGPPERWGQTLRSMLWTHASVVVPPFSGSATIDLPVPCTYDFNVASTKYFYALEDGEIPLCLLFSGTVFHEGEDGALQVAQISWEKEANFRLPVSVWKAMMEIYYPNSAWLCLHKDVFDRLYEYKRRGGLPTWERALENLLVASEQPLTPVNLP